MDTMRFYLDTEFIEAGAEHPIYLVSIGLVSEQGKEYYAESSDFPSNIANSWVREYVFSHLTWKNAKPRLQIRQEVHEFILDCCGMLSKTKPEFWGYYCDYDWVVFCQLFGNMASLPQGWPMYCRDIKQWCDDLGNPELPIVGKNEHNALIDAHWNYTAWHFLNNLIYVKKV